MKELFELRGKLSGQKQTTIEIMGVILFFVIWEIVAQLRIWSWSILPPFFTKVCPAFVDLFRNENFFKHVLYSLQINMMGCIEAVLFALPLGLALGLIPVFQAMTARQLAAIRYLPLPMLTGIFIRAYGIESLMKMQFLACSIFVFLVPAVVQRVCETPQVYVDTVRTLGASRWQTFREVFVPDVLRRVSTDIINLLAISWTYITIVEVINLSDGGIGAVSSIAARRGRADIVYAAILTIMILGFLIDKVGQGIDRLTFKDKYA